MLADLRHLLRNLRRAPASAAAAIVTLSLTIGAGASIFALVDAVLLTPPPFADPGALVVAGETPMEDPAAAPRAVAYQTFERWRERAGSLAAMEAFDGTNLTLTGLGAAERVSATNVTPRFFSLVGVAPALGRAFDRDDVGQRVVVVSHAFWRGTLAADPRAVGRSLVLGGQPHTIVGVLPERFVFALNACDLWRPFPVPPAQAIRAGYRVRAIARLARPGAAADLRAALDDVSREASPPMRASVAAISTAIAGGAARMLAVLAGAAALALAIAFTNLAGLLIVRSIDRRRELAVRSALGAQPREIARQLLVEAEALVAIGIGGGVLLALWLTPAAGRLALAQFADLTRQDVPVSWRSILAAAIVALTAGSICAWLPAAVASRRSIVEVLRRGATPPPRERTLRRALVTGEVALAFVLLASVAMLGRSLYGMLDTNPGFDPRGVMAMNVSLPAAQYTTAARVAAFYTALQRALEDRFGARAVSIVDELPLTGDRGRRVAAARPTDIGREAVVRAASPGYFDVMRIPIVAGRAFDAGDNASAPARVVLSRSLAERLFASDDPIGRRVWFPPTAQTADVVGVVGDVKHRALDEGTVPTVYVSALQEPSHANVIVVRSGRPDADVIAAVRDEVARLDPALPVYRATPMANVVSASPGVPARRVLMATFLGFAILAVVLGSIGLFGVVAHDVACRRAELAIRMALGADRARILGTTAAPGAMMVAAGLAAGGVLSIWAARALVGLGFATQDLDALSAAVAAAALVAAGAAAVLPAAVAAMRTDPLIALRSE
jgi:putative ABC transport system permease protein